MPWRIQQTAQQRQILVVLVALIFVGAFIHLAGRESYDALAYKFKSSTSSPTSSSQAQPKPKPKSKPANGAFRWEDLPFNYPLKTVESLPIGQPKAIPRIQTTAPDETPEARKIRLEHLAAVKEAFTHSWKGYKEHAWKSDEVGPLTGDRHDYFGGWAASLVDALDTLWIMSMKEEFEDAIKAVESIDFTKSTQDEINVFETTIRYLGGFLSAYDLSGAKYPILLQKATELGEMLLHACDTSNHMPITRWKWQESAKGLKQAAPLWALSAEVGSLTLEFTRLSQLTGDMRYYDAVKRIMDEFRKQQMKTKLPGMWPIQLGLRTMQFGVDRTYTLGAMSDSLYEYLPKQHLLLGGLIDDYHDMYAEAAATFTKYSFFQAMLPNSPDLLFSGLVSVLEPMKEPEPSFQHLVCFAGGMVGIGAKIFSRQDDLNIARRLVDGCVWAYESMPNGLMAETSNFIPCTSRNISESPCAFDEDMWHQTVVNKTGEGPPDWLPKGYANIPDRRYILRPEAIESVFIWYRISGDVKYMDKAWKMFQAIEKHTRTEIAHAALDDITQNPPTKSDRMESFWMAETLKYFYLIFSEFDVVSLDEYVFNTEAHPFLRPK